jgi:hypothetical protein
MRWEVDITGSFFDLRELAKTVTLPEVTITEESGKYVLKSSRFGPTGDSHTIRQEAGDLIRILDGAAAAMLGRRQPLGLGAICLIHDDGRKELYVEFNDTLHLGDGIGTVTVKRLDGTEEVFHPAHRVPAWLNAALKDATVTKVLRDLSREQNWHTLYNVHETIKLDVGGEGAIESAGWATKKEQGRFTHTANNYQAVAEDARHSREDRTPPANPMPLSEAAGFIKALAQAWLNYKAGP